MGRFWTLAMMLGVAGVGWGCSHGRTVVESGPELVVALEGNEVAVGGVRVQLGVAKTEQLLEGVSDAAGVVRFRGLKPGKHVVMLPGDGLVLGLIVEVLDESAPTATVTVGWPVRPPAKTKRLRGIVRRYEGGKPLPYDNLGLDLLEAYTGKLIESVKTEPWGEFYFATREPGVYILKPHGDLWSTFVVLDPAGGKPQLELHLGGTSCGNLLAPEGK